MERQYMRQKGRLGGTVADSREQNATRSMRKEVTMRMLMQVKIPHCKFNAAVKDGTIGQKMKKILEETKPEATYFTEYDGHRGAIMVVNVDNPSKVPVFAEPWFFVFDADVQFHIVLSPEDLGRAGLEGLAKKWC